MPVVIGLCAIYPWPNTEGLGNAWYLNTGFFLLRCAIDVVLWNLLAAYALWLPRGLDTGIAPALSWVSAMGLLLLALLGGWLQGQLGWYPQAMPLEPPASDHGHGGH